MKAKIDIRQDKRNGKEYAYILDECFYGDEHKGDFTTDEARLWLILSCFKNWDCEHERRKFPILSDRIGDWLRGLPSVCSVDYGADKILQRGQEWGLCSTEKGETRFIFGWYQRIGRRIVEMIGKLGLDYGKILPYDDTKTIQEQMGAASGTH
ncbi:MAG: hypothetical protein IJM04_04485 [Prevotella sp.]|nr:hypothetical protein [Prevotella sp.]